MDISESIDETQLQPARAAVMKLLEKVWNIFSHSIPQDPDLELPPTE